MGKTALIVDDSKTARVVLRRVLETHDLSVDTAESAEEALIYLRDNRPAVIFMDHQMPGMDGLEAVSTIKNNPATASIPIMMYTAQKGEVYVGQARALGAAGVLPKQVEPVEVSKVLASLRIVGPDGEQRTSADETEVVDASGSYPDLERSDQNLRILIQDLFDQQRAILRRDLLDSHEVIAARVADEIRPAEIDAGDLTEPTPKKDLPTPLQWLSAVSVIIAIIFIWLFWQSEKGWQDSRSENARLLQTLTEQQAAEAQGTLQAQQQFDDHQQTLKTTRAAALSSIKWAANQSSQYGIDELPMDDFRLSVITELSNHLMALHYEGLVRIESHVGDYCMSFTGPDGYALATADLPAVQCDRIGFDSVEAYELGLRQSVGFANFISLADERTGGKIRFEVISFGNSKPLLDYPATIAGETASTWNEIAASNHRVDISLHPDEQ